MDINNFPSAFFAGIVSILLISSTACTKKECEGLGDEYLFELPVTLSPAVDTFQVGDTITIISEFSHKITDINSGNEYVLDNFDFWPAISIGHIDTIPVSPAANSFNILVEIADEFKVTDLNIAWIYQNLNQYSFRSRIIANRKGLFYLGVWSALDIEDPNQAFSGKCKKMKSKVAFIMNDRSDNNFHMLDDNPDPQVYSQSKEEFDRLGTYCFYVTE